MNARQVLIVSDSCYSGALSRSVLARLEAGRTPEAQQTWLQTMAKKRSRTVLTSGGVAPVSDSGGGQHSIFARAFLDVLRQSNFVLSGQQLFQEVSARVTYAMADIGFVSTMLADPEVMRYYPAPLSRTEAEGSSRTGTRLRPCMSA